MKFIMLLLFPVVVCAGTVNLNVVNAPLARVIAVLAAQNNETVVMSDNITHKLSLAVHDVDASQLLKTLLIKYKLARIKMGNVVYIAPDNELVDAASKFQPLSHKVVALKFADAKAVAEMLQRFPETESSKMVIQADERANTILLIGQADRLKHLRRIITEIDVPLKQVLIEVRLVSIDIDAEQELGVNLQHVDASLQDGMRVPIKLINQLMNLDLKLSALAREGKAELISSPSLYASNQHEAAIEAGEEVPYQEVSQGGGTAVKFKKAVLGLRVTPQVLPDNKILLSLQINQDRPQAKLIQGVPTISTRQIKTSVTLKDGETMVLGGIFESNHEFSRQTIPILGKIPVLGQLLSRRVKRDDKRELLIFVTPRISDS